MRKARGAALAALALLQSAAVFADPPPWAPAHGRRAHDEERYDQGRYDEGRRAPPYYAERRLTSRDRIWRGDDGRYHCRRSDGTTGLIVGAAVGGLVGRALDDGRDRTAGTVIGLAGGALLGRAIDRGQLRCR